MEQVRYGIIGVGNQGTSYFVNLFSKGLTKDAVVTALCDIEPKKLDIIREKVEDPNMAYFTDYKELLDSGLCDAVLIEVPHYDHPEMVMEATKRGIHVICEKPAGVYTAQVREMNEAASKSNALFGMMFNQRTNGIYRKMKDMIAAGELGELQRVNWIITNWFRTEEYYKSGEWRATWEGEGGGVLINQAPHQIDLVQWIVGEMPISVNGFCKYGQWHDVEVEDEVTAYFEYANGASGVFITTTGEAPGSNRLEISGTKGKLLCENNTLTFYKNEVDSKEFLNSSPDGYKKPPVEVIELGDCGGYPKHVAIINNFTAAVLGKEPLFVNGQEGIHGVELMNAIEFSGWMGGAKVTLPIDEKAYLEELNKRRATSRKKEIGEIKVVDTSGSY